MTRPGAAAVVLLSGGLDSAVALAEARAPRYALHALPLDASALTVRDPVEAAR